MCGRKERMAELLTLFERRCKSTGVECPLEATVRDLVKAFLQVSGFACGSLTFQGEELDPDTTLADASVCSQATVEFVAGVPWKPPRSGTMKAVDMLSEANWRSLRKSQTGWEARTKTEM